MVKIKKGRQTNNSTGRKKATPPRLRQAREKRKENEAKSDEIDITTLADDDPTPSIRSKVRGFMALMGDDSSEEQDVEGKATTPRRGEDKKRQRFANETEVIEIENENDTPCSSERKPAPVRLTDRMESDSVSSNQSVTIADILGEGPEDTVELPQPLVISKDCRYTCQVKVPPSDSPTQFIAGKLSNFMKWIQDKIGKDLSIATWDDTKEKQRIYSKIQQLPKPTETTDWTAIWGTWVNVKPQQEGTAYLKIRFMTKSPDKLTKRLNELGELREEMAAATGITISRLPIACQAVQVGCIGWLFGSNKHMNSNDLLAEIGRIANIPSYIRMGTFLAKVGTLVRNF